MLINSAQKLCDLLSLGVMASCPTTVIGGLVNKVWHITTDTGAYAVKELRITNITGPQVLAYYETTEKIAEIFATHNIKSVAALLDNGQAVHYIDSAYFIVYPWVNAKNLDKDAISALHASKVAALLAKIHQLNLELPELTAPNWDIHEDSYIAALIEKCKGLPFTIPSAIFTWNSAYKQAIPRLNEKLVISHGDLDQKNVLWDQNDNPILIDFESARMLNPTAEIIQVALDWSSVTSCQLDEEIFASIFASYFAAGGKIDGDLDDAFYSYLGNTINWLLFNLNRCFDSAPLERKFAQDHVPEVINMMKYLAGNMERFKSLIEVI